MTPTRSIRPAWRAVTFQVDARNWYAPYQGPLGSRLCSCRGSHGDGRRHRGTHRSRWSHRRRSAGRRRRMRSAWCCDPRVRRALCSHSSPAACAASRAWTSWLDRNASPSNASARRLARCSSPTTLPCWSCRRRRSSRCTFRSSCCTFNTDSASSSVTFAVVSSLSLRIRSGRSLTVSNDGKLDPARLYAPRRAPLHYAAKRRDALLTLGDRGLDTRGLRTQALEHAQRGHVAGRFRRSPHVGLIPLDSGRHSLRHTGRKYAAIAAVGQR